MKTEKILYHFNTPNDVPNAYTKTSLVAYIQHHIESNYKFTYWEIELEEKKVLVIYGGMLKKQCVTDSNSKGSLLFNDGFVHINRSRKNSYCLKKKAALQIFNQNGEEVFCLSSWKEKNIFSNTNRP